MARLVRDARLRQRLAEGALAALSAATLGGQAAGRRAAFLGLVPRRQIAATKRSRAV
jgi:hypothetical protein